MYKVVPTTAVTKECFEKKGALESFAEFTRKHVFRGLFYYTVTYDLIEEKFRQGCSFEI